MAKKKEFLQSTQFIPPVVTVLGHVDHGKTTLLDTIRKTNIAAKEAGGITQKIGAYQVKVPLNSKNQKPKTVTFIDTPGHEAFTKMRSRGANVADIAILVVAANDGLMPQTIESIKHIKEAKIPFIVAATKTDLPEANLDKVKQQLGKQDIVLEEYGGDVPFIPVSAKANKGIDKLLSMIILLTEFHEIKADPKGQFKAVTIESGMDRARGPVITIIVKNGSIKKGETIVTSEGTEARVRVMFDENSKELEEASPGQPAMVLGLPKVPVVGTIIYKKSEEAMIIPQTHELEIPQTPGQIETLPPEQLAVQKLKMILKTDNAGSLEAILYSLRDNTNIQIISKGTGNITESDVILAKSSGAIIIGFQVKPSSSVVKLAQSEKVMIKIYSIIYEMLDEISDVIEALQSGGLEEKLGEAKVIAIFNIKGENIAGIKVVSGRIAKGDKIKLLRGEVELGRTKIKSLKHQKVDITKAMLGEEAGLTAASKLDFSVNDSIIAIG